MMLEEIVNIETNMCQSLEPILVTKRGENMHNLLKNIEGKGLETDNDSINLKSIWETQTKL